MFLNVEKYIMKDLINIIQHIVLITFLKNIYGKNMVKCSNTINSILSDQNDIICSKKDLPLDCKIVVEPFGGSFAVSKWFHKDSNKHDFHTGRGEQRDILRVPTDRAHPRSPRIQCCYCLRRECQEQQVAFFVRPAKALMLEQPSRGVLGTTSRVFSSPGESTHARASNIVS